MKALRGRKGQSGGEAWRGVLPVADSVGRQPRYRFVLLYRKTKDVGLLPNTQKNDNQ